MQALGNIPPSEYNALYDIYNATNGADWIWTASLGNEWTFTDNANPCAEAWQGIICFNTTGPNNVLSITLSEMNLVGTIPSSVGAFRQLVVLDLDTNEIYGDIPDSVYTLTNLNALILDYNIIGGTLSSNVSNLTQLENLGLYTNQMTGTIPNSIGTLSMLVYASLGINQFEGTIPASIGNLPKVQYVYVDNNRLTGPLPPFFINAANILYFDFSDNELDGSLPASYGNMRSIIQISFFSNYLTGTIPASFAGLSTVQNLILGENDLSGPFPPYLGSFTSLFFVDVSFNHLNSTIPTDIGNVAGLKRLYGFNNLLSGTIPPSMINMNLLTFIGLYENQLTGPIPPFGYLPQLEYFELDNNQLSGPIPNTFNFPLMYIFDLSHNVLTGTVPSSFASMTSVVFFYFGTNLLTGTLPSILFTVNPELYGLDINSNQLTGTLPAATHSMTPIFQYFNAFNNLITGTLPESFGTLTTLQFLFMYYNQLTGTIPNSFSGMTYMEQLDLSYNLLTGSIPTNLGNVPFMQFLELETNLLTGPIPASVSQMLYLLVLILSDNRLSGSLEPVFNSSIQIELATVVLNNNQLTGSIPEELFRLQKLNSFTGVSNCFEGKFPANMCNATTLNSLALDGLSSASNCRNTLFPGLSSSYIVTSSVSSTVPECLFNMPVLTTLHLSGNGLTGSLPDVQINPLLIDLALSHNVLTGTIPARYQRRRWYNLDLSYNRFTGSLLSEFQSVHLNKTYYDLLSNVTGLNITAGTAQSSLSLENNRLSGRLPRTVKNMQNVSVLGSNVFSCDLQETNLPAHDSGRANYQCGSDSFNVPFYIWLINTLLLFGVTLLMWRYRMAIEAFLGLDYALGNINKWQNALQVHQATLDPARRLVTFQAVLDLSRFICVVGAHCTLYIVVILLPLYTVSSVYSGTLLHQYAWTVSAAYLTGDTVTALLFVALAGLVALAAFGYSRFCREHSVYIITLVRNSLRRSNHKKYKVPSIRTVLIYGGFICLNLIAVVGANVAYVYVAIYGKNDVLLIAQLSLSCFKLFWNRFFSVYLIRWTARLKSMTEQRTTGNSVDTADTSASGRTPGDRNSFVTLQLFVSLLNNIAVPCLAVAGISPSCFYNLFVGAPTINTQYTYQFCTLVDGAVCATSAVGELYMAYKPPFTYNYQCSSSFITYYAPTFVFMCIMRAFLSPLLQWVLYYLHRDATPGTQWHKLLDSVILMSLRPVTSAADIRIDVYRPYFDANQMLLSLFTYTGLLLTFGAVFPPVALALLFTLVSVLYFNQLQVGRLLCIAVERGLLEYADVIEAESRRAGFLSVLSRVVWMLITVSCWFYTLFLFDTLGDAVGFDGAYWVLIVVPLLPLAAYLLFSICTSVRRRDETSTADASVDDKVTTHNVLQTQSGSRPSEMEMARM